MCELSRLAAPGPYILDTYPHGMRRQGSTPSARSRQRQRLCHCKNISYIQAMPTPLAARAVLLWPKASAAWQGAAGYRPPRSLGRSSTTEIFALRPWGSTVHWPTLRRGASSSTISRYVLSLYFPTAMIPPKRLISHLLNACRPGGNSVLSSTHRQYGRWLARTSV